MSDPATNTDADSPPRARGPWLVVLAVVLVLVFLFFKFGQPAAKPPLPPGGVATPLRPGAPQFELLIAKLVQNRQRLELVRVDFEHWKEHAVSKDILKIKDGSLTDQVTRFAPDWLRERVLKSNWNQSTAHIITKCKVVVTFDVSFEQPGAWRVRGDGDTLTVNAPAINLADVNVLPETFQGWVLEEDLLIRGDREKDNLLKSLRQDLLPIVGDAAFKNRYRETCRANLQQFFRSVFAALPDAPTRDLRHVYVRFADDPPTETAATPATDSTVPPPPHGK